MMLQSSHLLFTQGEVLVACPSPPLPRDHSGSEPILASSSSFPAALLSPGGCGHSPYKGTGPNSCLQPSAAASPLQARRRLEEGSRQ